MRVEITNRPGSAVAHIGLTPGETVTTEGGAMIAMTGDLRVTTTTHKKSSGGVGAALKRMLAGESFFLNHYESAPGRPGDLYLSTVLPGDMQAIELRGGHLIVSAGCFVAADHSVQMNVGWQGFKNLFSGESLFWLDMSGQGTVVLSSFGMIFPVDVRDEYIVDTGHIVAFDDTLTFSLSKAGSSWFGSFLSGEGIICRFRGSGRVWCQSHTPTGFGRTIGPKLKPR